MATINRSRLIIDEELWLPDGNELTEAHMQSINESIISQVGDDSVKYAEVLCKSLRAIALANKAKFQVDLKGLKKDKAGGVELEFFEGTTQDPWGDFIKSLADICPILGYTALKPGIGMSINAGDKFKITNGVSVSNLIGLDISCPNSSAEDDGLAF
jgi:hypothetical protein